MTTTTAQALFATILCAGLLAGCERQAAPAAPAEAAAPAAAKPAPVACKLVTAEAAQKVLGQPVSLMVDDNGRLGSVCTWVSSGAPGRIAMLTVNLFPNESADEAGELFASLSGLQSKLAKMVNDKAGVATKKSGQEIEGLGDEAWQSSDNLDLIGNTALVVRRGSFVLRLAVTGMTRGDGLGAGLPERLKQATATAVGML
jgi:hypothetical protein